MSELTKIDELKQKHNAAFHHGFATAYAVGAEAVAYAESLVRELLAIREAGDEEVQKLFAQIWGALVPAVAMQAEKLRDIAIARGQQLREAKRREQIMAHHCQTYVEMTWEQAEAAYNAAEPVEISREEIDRIVGLVLAMNDEELEEKDLRQQLRESQAEIERLKVSSFAAPEGTTIQSLQSQITTLTAERDEARKDLEKQIDITYEAKAVVSQMQKDKHDNDGLANQRFTDDKEKIDLLTSELAALKSSPGMEEVDALSGDFTAEECDQPCLTTWMQRNKKLADLARRSNAAQQEEKRRADEAEHAMLEAVDAINEDYQEVVGLLKWVWKIIVCNELILSYIRRCDKPEAKAILEIVEGE